MQGASFSMIVVPRSVGCHAGELLMDKPHGEGSPDHTACTPLSPWIPCPSLHLCLLGFSQVFTFLALLSRRKHLEGDYSLLMLTTPSSGKSALGVSSSTGTLQHVGAALQLLKENWEIQKSRSVHKCLWNILQSVNFPQPKAPVELATTAKAVLA